MTIPTTTMKRIKFTRFIQEDTSHQWIQTKTIIVWICIRTKDIAHAFIKIWHWNCAMSATILMLCRITDFWISWSLIDIWFQISWFSISFLIYFISMISFLISFSIFGFSAHTDRQTDRDPPRGWSLLQETKLLLYHIIRYYTILYDIISCYIVWCDVILYYIISY